MDNNLVANRPSERHLVRKVSHFLFGSWAAWIYLALVAASIGYAVISLATDSGDDPNFAGVWPFFATMPWSLVFIGFVAETSDSISATYWLVGIVAISALANLATIGGLMHVIRRPPTPRPHAGAQTGPQAPQAHPQT